VPWALEGRAFCGSMQRAVFLLLRSLLHLLRSLLTARRAPYPHQRTLCLLRRPFPLRAAGTAMRQVLLVYRGMLLPWFGFERQQIHGADAV